MPASIRRGRRPGKVAEHGGRARWLASRKAGVTTARYPRRKRGLMPVRYYHGTFTLQGRRLRLPVARGCPPLWVRLDRDVPYPAGQIRSVTLLNEGRRLYAEITAEVPVATYPAGQEPDTGRVAGVDPGVIHPFAVAGPDGQGLLVSGRAIRAAGPGTRSRSGSRTAGPGTTSQMSPRLDVTRGAALITAVRQGPLAGRGPPHPEVGTSLAYRPSRNARIA